MDSSREQNAVARIAEYAANLSYDDLTQLAVARARQIILDTLGTMLGGYQSRLGKLVADYAATMMPSDEASLVADGRRSTAEGAAWANGVMGKHFGMDDLHRIWGHTAAELVPVVLALGEQYKLSGQQIITALAVGYDVMLAIQPNVKEWQRERGLDHKGQAGTLASAVTAAVAMRLNKTQIANALALSMDMASGTEQYVYDAGKCDTKDLLAGYAARNGIYAAKLAAFGFEGPPGALDGPYGYFHAFGPGYDAAYLDDIGKRFAIEEATFKPHAGCRHVHACVDATQALLKDQTLNLDDIASIEIYTYKEAITPSFRVNYEPQSVGQAGFSLPVTVSVVLTQGNWYREAIETYDSPSARRLRHLVKVGLAESELASGNSCEVRIHTMTGRQYQARVLYAKGEPENMLTEAEFEHKFRYLVGNLLPEARIIELITTGKKVETLADVGILVSLTRPEVVLA